MSDHLVTEERPVLTPTFHRLPPQRQQAVLGVCLHEFVEHGYEAASTNRIVAQLGIAKGTLFKYAPGKEALYLHLYEEVITELARLQGDPSLYTSPDLFLRLDELLEALLGYAQRNPLRYRFSLRASLDRSVAVHSAVEALRRRISSQHLDAIFAGVDWDLYALPRAEVLEVFQWLAAGGRAAAIETLGSDLDDGAYAALVRRQLDLMRRLLRSGVYRSAQEQP